MDRPDRIHLTDHIRAEDIGAFQTERGQSQRLSFNIEVELNAPVTGARDDVDEILSYDRLVEAVDLALEDRRYNLLETLAEKIAAELLAHSRAAQVRVRIDKLDRGPGALGVTISRRAGRVAAEGGDLPPSLIVPARALDRSDHGTGPRVVVPDADADIGADISKAARMVQLLKLDQAGWRLAEAHGLIVADSRTELVWAISEGLTVVWAPARMCADVTDLSPTSAATARWLAGVLPGAELARTWSNDNAI